MSANTSAKVRVDCCSDHDQLRALREPWDLLLQRAPLASAAQSYDYAMAGWEAQPKTAQTRLSVILIWRDEVLESVWPLYVRQDGWKMVAYHLGSGSNEEYAGPLIHSSEPLQIFGLAFEKARTQADILKIFNMPASSALTKVLADFPGYKHHSDAQSPVVRLGQFEDMEAWLASKSRSFRQGLGADRKRLRGLGEVKFVPMAGPKDGPLCIDWIFSEKRRWLIDQQRQSNWIEGGQGQTLFSSLSERDPAEADYKIGDIPVHALMVGEDIAAASICLISSDRVEFNVMAVNPKYKSYSAGSLLTQDCLELAIKQGLDFDFRLTGEAYKLRWIDSYDQYDCFWIACTPKGHLALFIDKVRIGIRSFRNANGPRLRAVLQKMRKGKG